MAKHRADLSLNHEIVKVQLPLASTERDPLALVYNKDRSFEVLMKITPAMKLLMKGRPKAFFIASFDKEGCNTVIEDGAPNQDW